MGLNTQKDSLERPCCWNVPSSEHVESSFAIFIFLFLFLCGKRVGRENLIDEGKE